MSTVTACAASSNARASANLTPNQAGAPAFPSILSAGAGAQPNVAWTVDPAFRVARTWQNNVQFEHALSNDYSFGIGASFVKGYDLPVVTNTNLINPINSTPSGIPIFSPTVSALTRVDPRYNAINASQSIGESTYRNLTLQFTRRQVRGIGFDLAYTLGKSEDNAPITSALSVQGDPGRTDPTNLDRDKGPNVLDQRHTARVGRRPAVPQVVGCDQPVTIPQPGKQGRPLSAASRGAMPKDDGRTRALVSVENVQAQDVHVRHGELFLQLDSSTVGAK